MVSYTGGAHVSQVLLLIFNPLQDSDLAGTAVPVVDQSAGGWGTLAVAANVTAGCRVSGTGLGHGGEAARLRF